MGRLSNIFYGYSCSSTDATLSSTGATLTTGVTLSRTGATLRTASSPLSFRSRLLAPRTKVEEDSEPLGEELQISVLRCRLRCFDRPHHISGVLSTTAPRPPLHPAHQPLCLPRCTPNKGRVSAGSQSQSGSDKADEANST